MKPAEAHITFIDHIRGVAVLLVFLYHCLGTTFWSEGFQLKWGAGWFRDFHVSGSYLALLPATLGWTGVIIFFVVSGFCIHLSHERSRQKGFKVFFLRRFFRIYPPYLAALLIFAFVFPTTKLDWGFAAHDSAAATMAGGQLVSHLFLVHNLDNDFHFGINGSFWSIAVEVQLYALYPLLLWLTTRLGWQRTLGITAIVELGMRSVSSGFVFFGSYLNPPPDVHQWFLESPLIYWFSWSMGAALADAYLKGRPLPFRNPSLFLCPVLFLCCYGFKPLEPFCVPLAALSATGVIAYLLNRPPGEPTVGGFGNVALNHLRWAGIVSYSAYLIHQPLLQLVRNYLPDLFAKIVPGHSVPLIVLYLCCVLSWFLVFSLSYLSYWYIELPSIAWGKLTIEKLRTSRSAPIIVAE